MTAKPTRKKAPGRTRQQIATHVMALRRLGCSVQIFDLTDTGGAVRATVALPAGTSKKDLDAKMATRAALAQMVKESAREIESRLWRSGIIEYDANLRHGRGGFTLTASGRSFGTMVGNIIYLDPKKTIRRLVLTPVA